MEWLIAPNLRLHALACGGRCCAERAREGRIVILDHILKPWQATSFEPWQAMVVRHCGRVSVNCNVHSEQ